MPAEKPGGSDFLQAMALAARVYGISEAARRQPWPKNLRLYREAYQLAAPLIKQGYDPYMIEVNMTPIERFVWGDLRSYGLPFYPQFPVGKYFVDFGDPKKRIAIECDGEGYHDRSKDVLRDAVLLGCGWLVIRIEGWRCARDEEDPASSTAIIAELAYSKYGRSRPASNEEFS